MSGLAVYREVAKELRGNYWKEIELECPSDCVALEVFEIQYSTPRPGLKFRISRLIASNYTNIWGSPEEIDSFKSTVTLGRKVFDPPIVIDSGDKFYLEVGRHGKGPTDVDVSILYFGVAGNGLDRALNRIKK